MCVPLQGFLIESKLNQLLAPLERDERCLMRLDAIFTVRMLDSAIITHNAINMHAHTRCCTLINIEYINILLYFVLLCKNVRLYFVQL